MWSVNERGRATHKTGAKADPRVSATVARSDAPAGSASNAQDPAVPARGADGRWWWTAPDGVRWWASSQPQAGDSVVGGGVTWDCVGGRMVQRGSQMAVRLPSSGGRWVKRCYGSYCRMEWVPN